ncbi:MAG: type II toxin-antitoxin system VapC family toxin [Afipia sp.]|nr:type II toxin-antitoxin system VapC family toxin [Afipia sp.]
MTTFVDTNILIYLLNDQEAFHGWAKEAVAERRNYGPLVVCDIVYSEFSVSMEDLEKTNSAIAQLAMERLQFTDEVLFRAGKAYQQHRQNGGSKSNVLPDFLIGAQAELEDAPLVTNDQKNYKTYFPKLTIIQPPQA